jgi:hypothetical protein
MKRASRSSSKSNPRLLATRRGLLAVAVLVAAVTLFPSERESSEYEGFKEGEIAPRQVVAPFDFDVPKPRALLDAEYRRARDGVASYFRRQEGVANRVDLRYDEFRQRIIELSTGPITDTLSVLRDVTELGVNLSDRAQRALLDDRRRRAVLTAADEFIDEVLATGLATEEAASRIRSSQRHMLWEEQSFSPVSMRDEVFTPERANRYAREQAQLRLPEDPLAVEAFRAIVAAFLEPNIRFDAPETARIEEVETSLVNPTERRVLRNEQIVDAHERITPETMRAIDALQAELNQRGQGRSGWAQTGEVAGRTLLTAAILVFCIVYLRLHRPRVYADTGKLTLLTITLLLVFAGASVVLNVLGLPWILIPVAAGSMVVSLLIDAQLGVFFTLVSVIMVALNGQLGLDFVSGSLVGGFTGVYAVQRVRHRSEIFRALLLVTMAYIFTVSSLALMNGEVGLQVLTDSGWGVLNAFVSTALAIFLIPVLEMTCRVTTDLTLLELSDLNRPLLRRLMLEAPGTYHHSMVMGTLVEAGCDTVGANSLLGRVQCYYHDIGKMMKPEYFIENIALNPSAKNPHERLTPSMSCLILESHVREGVQLAREYKIPEVLIDAIREHHGTMEMSYFYEKAKAIDPSVDRDDFRYPGPRPQTKETAIVMLADGVEAASRLLSDPRPSRIRGLVIRVIESRVEAGQLEQCALTLADLARIREAFVLVLTGMFHGRIRYPAEKDASLSDEERERRIAEESGVGVDEAVAAAEGQRATRGVGLAGRSGVGSDVDAGTPRARRATRLGTDDEPVDADGEPHRREGGEA